MININDSAFVVIDIQEKLVKAVNNAHSIAQNAQKLAQLASLLSVPMLVTEQYPKGLGQSIEDLKNSLPQDTPIIEKSAFSALKEDEFRIQLSKINKKQIILAGIETHICVLQTALELAQNGYEVYVLQDVTASRNETEHLAGIDLMKQHSIKIITLEILLFILLQTSKHPRFKEVQKLIL